MMLSFSLTFGSTHNFISHELAAKLGIQEFEMGDAMKVDGAFIGQDASVTPLIGKLRLHIQGYVDKEDFFISPLKREDVILGAPWFDRLAASIKFPERKISFKFKEKDMYIVAQESVVMALAVAEVCTIRCDYEKFILESLVEGNLKGSAKNKLYMSAGPMLTRIAYQDLVKTTTTTTSSRATRSSKKSSSDDERIDTDKEDDSKGSDKEGDSQGLDKEQSQKGAEAKEPSEHEKNDEEDTSTPLDKKSKKPRSEQQVVLAKAQARVEERKKMLADARASKAVAKQTLPMIMEQARLARIEKAKALQEERWRIEAEQKAQEVDLTSQSTQGPIEKEVVDIIDGHIEHLKKIQRDKNIKEQRAAALALEKIQEGLKRSAEQAVLESQEGEPKKQHQEEDEENLKNIQITSVGFHIAPSFSIAAPQLEPPPPPKESLQSLKRRHGNAIFDEEI
ncbi:hypothetical protein L7F22_068926 [Adiantum nelumboides]|nr:hypothetical protein [Adiantum nelumboides]